MNSNERKVVNTAWAYLRDHAKTQEGQAIRDSLSRILRDDITRRGKRSKQAEETPIRRA